MKIVQWEPSFSMRTDRHEEVYSFFVFLFFWAILRKRLRIENHYLKGKKSCAIMCLCLQIISILRRNSP